MFFGAACHSRDMMWVAVEQAAKLKFGKVKEDGGGGDFVCFCVWCVCAARMNSIATHLQS